ncbi:hypothetical protein CDAR_191331 [Caerostris darwini]|uniref:Uncharacterized protein n=1 Tax=Caerostris darwini TaxID=1538125 RepID=A0AAV4VF50_9ARAC|nr:hypothetical protein CDAR_191331 [Caerostris darwini]
MGGQTVIQTGNDIAEATKHANPGSSLGRAMHPSWKEDACSCPSKQPESCLTFQISNESCNKDSGLNRQVLLPISPALAAPNLFGTCCS